MRAAIEYDTWDQASYIPRAESLLQSYGYETQLVSSEDILYGELFNGYDLLNFPGGMGAFDGLRKYGANFRDAVRYFVANGGGYLGICGGAYVGGISMSEPMRTLTATTLGLVDIEITTPPFIHFLNEYIRRQKDIITVGCHISVTSHAVTEGHLGEQSIVSYSGGPCFQKQGISVAPLLTYEEGSIMPVGDIAACASVFGKGRVVLCSVHPECPIEEERPLGWFYEKAVRWVSEPEPEVQYPILPWETKRIITVPWGPIAVGALIGGAILVTRRK